MITLEYVFSFPMSIPDFQTIMLPLLELAGDSKEYKLAEAIELLATHFNLTDIDRKELLPSGKQARFANRVGWATTAWCASMVGEPDRSASATQPTHILL